MYKAASISKRSSSFLSVDPIIKALLLAVLAAVAVQFVSRGDSYNVSAIYSGVFGILAIFAGFLATFLVFVATKSNKFLESIRHTETFRQMLGLLRFTIFWTLLAVGFTFVMMVIEPRDYSIFGLVFWVVFTWAWVILLIFVNFSRCISMFFSVVQVG